MDKGTSQDLICLMLSCKDFAMLSRGVVLPDARNGSNHIFKVDLLKQLRIPGMSMCFHCQKCYPKGGSYWTDQEVSADEVNMWLKSDGGGKRSPLSDVTHHCPKAVAVAIRAHNDKFSLEWSLHKVRSIREGMQLVTDPGRKQELLRLMHEPKHQRPKYINVAGSRFASFGHGFNTGADTSSIAMAKDIGYAPSQALITDLALVQHYLPPQRNQVQHQIGPDTNIDMTEEIDFGFPHAFTSDFAYSQHPMLLGASRVQHGLSQSMAKDTFNFGTFSDGSGGHNHFMAGSRSNARLADHSMSRLGRAHPYSMPMSAGADQHNTIQYPNVPQRSFLEHKNQCSGSRYGQ